MGRVEYYGVIKQPRRGHTKARLTTSKYDKKVRGTLLRKEIRDFEKGFPDGVFAGPTNPEEPVLQTRAMLKYCRENGLDPEKLTKEQLKPFYGYPKY